MKQQDRKEVPVSLDFYSRQSSSVSNKITQAQLSLWRACAPSPGKDHRTKVKYSLRCREGGGKKGPLRLHLPLNDCQLALSLLYPSMPIGSVLTWDNRCKSFSINRWLSYKMNTKNDSNMSKPFLHKQGHISAFIFSKVFLIWKEWC